MKGVVSIEEPNSSMRIADEPLVCPWCGEAGMTTAIQPPDDKGWAEAYAHCEDCERGISATVALDPQVSIEDGFRVMFQYVDVTKLPEGPNSLCPANERLAEGITDEGCHFY